MAVPPEIPPENGVAATVREVVDRTRNLARLEAELATIELRRKAASFGAGAGLIVAAVVAGLYALGFGLATFAAALALVLPTWLALLLVTVVLLLTAVAAALGGRALLRRATPPVPEQALAEAKATKVALTGERRD